MKKDVTLNAIGAVIVLMGSLCVSSGAATAAACSEEDRAKAQGFYEEAKKVFSENYDEPSAKTAIAKLEQSTELCADPEAPWLLLSHIYWQMGDWLPHDAKKERIHWFAKGEAAAKKVLEPTPNNGKALYWKTVNMAAIADVKGWLSNLWVYPTLYSNMERVKELEPHYLDGGVSRFWCEVLSRVPLFLGERFGHPVDEVLSWMDEEIQAEPRVFCNYNSTAKLLWKAGQKDKALSYLEYVLRTDPGILPGHTADNRWHQRLARQLWTHYTGKEFPNR